jgi:SAM-dependent methyltransferase
MVECAACGIAKFASFFRSREWSTSGRYLSEKDGYIRAEPIAIQTEYCEQCGLIRQTPGSEVRLDYADIARDTAKQLPDYAHRVIESLAQFGVGSDDLVVEVGANDGTFLNALRDAGYHNLIGVEPSRRLAACASKRKLSIHQNYFGRELAAKMVQWHGPARAVICRHTLEHVPDIRDLTCGIADILAPSGLAFIEVPDTDWIVLKLFAHEIWDEHLTYFRARSLVELIRRAGLAPVDIQRIRFRDTRNLLCWSMRANPPLIDLMPKAVKDATTPTDLAAFQHRWDTFAARLRAAVSDTPRPVVAIGAAHIQLNFLNFAGVDDCIDLLIDDDPVKAGRYAPLSSPVPIRTTAEALASIRCGTLLRTAFPYARWQDRICAVLSSFGVVSINPYDLKYEPASWI